MEIAFTNRRLERELTQEVRCIRKHGPRQAKKIQVRLTGLRAAISLADFWPPNQGSERCHELTGDLKGHFSFDLVHPYRLLVRPTGDLNKADFDNEHEYWAAITAVEIVSIEDTHA